MAKNQDKVLYEIMKKLEHLCDDSKKYKVLPNVYDLIDVNGFKKNIHPIPLYIDESLNNVWSDEKEKFKKNDLYPYLMAYRICVDCYEGKIVEIKTKRLFQMLAGISLIAAVNRNTNPNYIFNHPDNIQDIKDVVKYLSKTSDIDLKYYLENVLEEVCTPKSKEELESKFKEGILKKYKKFIDNTLKETSNNFREDNEFLGIFKEKLGKNIIKMILNDENIVAGSMCIDSKQKTFIPVSVVRESLIECNIPKRRLLFNYRPYSINYFYDTPAERDYIKMDYEKRFGKSYLKENIEVYAKDFYNKYLEEEENLTVENSKNYVKKCRLPFWG